jgi:hypothetical protein
LELSELKQSREFLAAVLGVEISKKCKCPFHDDGTESFSVFTKDRIWFWKCHAGCGSGTIIDAAMKKYRVSTAKEAISRLGDELGQSFQPDVELCEVVLDTDRAEKLIAQAHANLLDRYDLQEEYLFGRRGIQNLETAKQYKLGFMENLRLSGKRYTIPKTWVLPITNAEKKLVAVKLHTEGRWQFYAGKAGPKCMWAPFGTHPAHEPKHGLQTLWPPPESFADSKEIFLCPGELKALAEISFGFPATSITGGESGIPERDVKRLKACGFATVRIVYDDDEPKKRPSGEWVSPGREWLAKVSAAVLKAGMTPIPFAASDRIPMQSADPVAERLQPSEISLECLPAGDVENLDALLSDKKSLVETQKYSLVEELCNRTKSQFWFSPALSFEELRQIVLWETIAAEKGFA